MLVRSFILVGLVSAGVTACGDQGVRLSTTRQETEGRGPLKVVRALQCPQSLGSLTRKGSAIEGGSVCVYAGERGAEVSLHLVALDGSSPEEALKAFETRLSASLPRAVSDLERAETDATTATATATATGDAPPQVAVETKGDKADIRLPGFQVSTQGDVATVNIGGLKIRADDTSGSVDVTGGGADAESVSVRASGDSVQVRSTTAGAATRANWILTDSRPSTDGWRMVGYEARGPVGGPIVVATTRSRDDDGGRASHDAKRLVILNVGQ